MNNINRDVWKETEFGKIPKNWDIVSLEDISLKITDGSHSSPPSVEKGYPMASVKDMTNSGFNLLSCRHISLSDYEMLVKNGCKPIKNDVLIAKDGSYLKEIFVVKEEIEMAILSSIAIIRPDMTKINPEYLKYFLSDSRIKKMVADGYVSGSVIPRIVLKNFRKIKIVSPPLEVQAKIAQILSSLDDKIELNYAINKNLEEIAQTLFNQWFVDFEFPNENGEPYKSSGGEMVESELGLIPKGWRIGKLGDIVDVKGGGTPSTKINEYWNGDINWATPKDLSNLKSLILLNTERKITEQGLSKISSGLLRENTVLLSSRAPIGYLALNKIPVAINQGFIAVEGHKEKGITNLFMLIWIKVNMDKIIARANGSTFLEISKSSFKEIQIIIPSLETLLNFNTKIENLFENIENNTTETQTLTKLRDELLPKLMSGEVPV